VINGGWNITDCVSRSYDLESMNVGTVAAGRIGLRVLRLLKPFDVKLHYLDRHRLPSSRASARIRIARATPPKAPRKPRVSTRISC
jgi:lactate dehydrogenase-like 2-hydroxyacid dehydrogenase